MRETEDMNSHRYLITVVSHEEKKGERERQLSSLQYSQSENISKHYVLVGFRRAKRPCAVRNRLLAPNRAPPLPPPPVHLRKQI